MHCEKNHKGGAGLLAEKPRILMLTGNEAPPAETLASLSQDREVVAIASLPEALARLTTEQFAGIYISSLDPALWQQARVLLQNEAILEVLGEGIAILQPGSRIL